MVDPPRVNSTRKLILLMINRRRQCDTHAAVRNGRNRRSIGVGSHSRESAMDVTVSPTRYSKCLAVLKGKTGAQCIIFFFREGDSGIPKMQTICIRIPMVADGWLWAD